jgi:uncharacterized protein YegJ (DUF2314 family)
MATKKETAAAQAVENAVETVEKTEAMAEAKAEEKAEEKAEAKDDGMVTIHLFKDDDRYSAPVFVGVNGDSYLIQRGMDVKVPKAVAEVLEHSIKQDAEAARKSQAMQAAAGTQMMTI